MATSQNRIKITYIIAHIDKAVGFEWIVERLDPNRFDISFILLNEQPSYLADYLRRNEITVYEIPFARKSKIHRALWETFKLLRKERPDVIHTHMLFADLVGQIAGRIANIRKRVYTRHSANENRKYHNKQWMDKLVNSIATHIVAISENVRRILIEEEGADPKSIRLIHHGFDMQGFANVPQAEIENLAKKYNRHDRRPVIGVIARYVHWKGLQYIVPAFERVLQQYPNAYLLLANAKSGSYKMEIDSLLSTLPADSYFEIEFENNLFALYQLFDVYVHTPIDPELEAFGQTYVEALAAGIPSVFTLSGIAKEFIKHESNALVVDFKNAEQIHRSMTRILEDDKLKNVLSTQGRNDVEKKFSIERQITKLESLYSE
jgi:glycosyltransferase involved in cell wall biosynthesis